MRHPARFRSLGFDSRHERPPAARPLTGALCPPPKGAHVEGARAGASNGAPVRDHEIRASLLATLERQFAGDPETLIVPEMDVHRGASGVDVAVVNGALRDYEIKRERDTLDRLSSAGRGRQPGLRRGGRSRLLSASTSCTHHVRMPRGRTTPGSPRRREGAGNGREPTPGLEPGTPSFTRVDPVSPPVALQRAAHANRRPSFLATAVDSRPSSPRTSPEPSTSRSSCRR
jgi:hypothetical protein